ncbi:DUF4870 domain-containing protein [Autumnicola musiva]|uniref:DUF4870 domain-containing protein n=1 Tax=Autumnicola musiva TaxID=3075589 RepID=A0ABU3D9Z5_9FLAO|nr:DUF4870 domain-containing protein [Zunongwangia sp. F117]MDT0678358.1 DUF4870 domain-containing protein [Zunongwangia sp. F117]
MNSQVLDQDKSLATLIHLSVFSKYLIPFGNFLFPLMLWLLKKQDPFVDSHGKNAVNFQISIFLYTILLGVLGIAILILFGVSLSFDTLYVYNDHIRMDNFQEFIPLIVISGIFGTLILSLIILEIYAVISASLKASEGEFYKYPLCISFISTEIQTGNVKTIDKNSRL